MVLLSSIATVGGFTMVSRVLGFLRDILIAAVLGAGAGAGSGARASGGIPSRFRDLR